MYHVMAQFIVTLKLKRYDIVIRYNNVILPTSLPQQLISYLLLFTIINKILAAFI